MGFGRYLALALALAGCDTTETDTATEEVNLCTPPGELVAGFDHREIPAPLGIGISGYLGVGVANDGSRYAAGFAPTTRVHGMPSIVTSYLSRGDCDQIVFVKMDTVGVFQQLRQAVILRVLELGGPDLNDQLMIAGTHTHSGPGRIVQGEGFYRLIADVFFPQFYERFVEAIARSIMASMANAAPAEIATGLASSDAHYDRRCEDGENYVNSAVPLVAVRQGGEITGLIGSYAIHSTVIEPSDQTLSGDVFGAINEAVEDHFDHPVYVSLFNSWGADMGPGHPDRPAQIGVEEMPGYARIHAAGAEVADDVGPVIDGLDNWTSTPDLGLTTHRVAIDREAIGYSDDVFPYEYGGVYCAGDGNCASPTHQDDMDKACLPFSEETPAPNQTMVSFGKIGDFHLMSLPGEPGTRLAESAMQAIQAEFPQVQSMMFLGYAQDYIGYSVLEDDWWLGGYEASGALWGPRQGDYLRDRAVDAARVFFGADIAEVPPITPFVLGNVSEWEVEAPVRLGDIVSDVSPELTAEDLISFTFYGTDSWLGNPVATLVRVDGDPLLRPNGLPWSASGYRGSLVLTHEPTVNDVPEATERGFLWTIEFPVAHRVADWGRVPPGTYQVDVQIPTPDGPLALRSAEFVVLN